LYRSWLRDATNSTIPLFRRPARSLHETRLIAYLTLAEQAVEAWERLNGVLHVRLDEEMQRPFECDESVGVRVGFRPIRNDEAARELVEPYRGRAAAASMRSECRTDSQAPSRQRCACSAS